VRYSIEIHGQAVPSGVVDPQLANHPQVHADGQEPYQGCTELTKAGEPCKGTPGDDGLCAAHKKAADSGDSK
jgi:hypothetical protein